MPISSQLDSLVFGEKRPDLKLLEQGVIRPHRGRAPPARRPGGRRQGAPENGNHDGHAGEDQRAGPWGFHRPA